MPESFIRAIGHERSWASNPFSDVMAGVDLLIDQGIADPERLGLMGHSYGCCLSLYGVTKTDRFKAASAHDGSSDMLMTMYRTAGNPEMMELMRVMWGLGSPFDSGEIEHVMKESPLHNFESARTPLLLEWATDGLMNDAEAVMSAALALGVPAELHVLPRSGHVTTEPRLILDSYERNLTWFNYWLLNEPYPDAGKQILYDQWKRDRTAALTP